MKKLWTIFIIGAIISGSVFAQTNLLPNGDLETLLPNFWSPIGDGQAGVTAEWAWEGYNNSEHSFKVTKTAATTNIAGWLSVNNADLYWNNAAADALYELAFWYKTDGVNTAPATDDEKIGVFYEVFGGGALLASQTVYLDQSAAAMDWTEATGGMLVPAGVEPDSAVGTLFMGKDAIGSVWFDNIKCSGSWYFNWDAETPLGWMAWASEAEVGFANLDDTHAHSGTYSTMLMETDDLADEMVFYSEPIPAEPSSWYQISVWVKHVSDSTNEEWIPTNITDYKHNYRMNLCFFSHAGNIRTSFSPTGGDQFFYFDEREADNDWRLYTVLYKTTEDATGLSVRARFNNFTKGTCWFDDFMVEKVELGPNLMVNGDLETLLPNFWSPIGDGQAGVTAEWAWEGYNNSDHSFKVMKTAATTNIAGWLSVNNADLYWNNAAADALYELAFWYKTDGVNTAPATDDEKIGVFYEVFGGGALLASQTVYLDQSAAAMDWTEATGGMLVPAGVEPDSAVGTLFMGKDAIGSVWFDNIKCSGSWYFNWDAETPLGWMAWASEAEVGYANLNATYAHGGIWSTMLMELDDLADEMVFYSEPVPAKPSTWYLVSVWVKREGGLTDPEWLPSNDTDYKHNDRMNLCYFSHAGNIRTSFSPTGGDRFFYFDERETDSDWTLYTVKYKTTEDATGFSMRARFNNFTQGTCWFDDFSVQEITHLVATGVEDWDVEPGTIPESFALKQNYPNPFNPTTQIGYVLDNDGFVELEVFNVMGQRVKSLVREHRQAGTYKVIWNGLDESGNQVRSGVYFYQLRTADNVVTRRMVFVK